MNELFIYLIKAAIINAIILAFYHFTLRNSNKFQLMRATLLSGMLLPIILPLIPYPFDLLQHSNNLPVITITLPETSIVTAETNSIFNWIEIPSLFYYGVSLVLLMGMVISITSIIQKRLRSKEHLTSFGRVELEHTVKSPFSFFSWVFLSPIDLKHPQLDMILRHEFCHVREKHSIDRVLSGIFRSVLWFSPFSHITSRLLSEVHEYQADSKVIGVYDRSDYSDLILSFYMNSHSTAISNNFSLHIKKRITMINNFNFNRLRYGRILIGLGFSLSLVFLTSMVTTTNQPITSIDENVSNSITTLHSGAVVRNITQLEPEVAPKYKTDPDTIPKAKLVRNSQSDQPDSAPQFPGGDKARIEYIVANTPYPEDARKAGIKGTVYVQFVIGTTGKVSDVKILKGVSPSIDKVALTAITNMPDWIPARKDNKLASYEMTMPIKFELSDDKVGKVAKDPNAGDLFSKENGVPQKKEGSRVFTVVEVAPEFPGGDDARVAYLNSNIIYPEQARKNGIQGTVYITFVVEPDGSITGAKVLRGVGGGLDEVALDVVKKMPKWTPGKVKGEPVPVQFNMPIKFKLQEDKVKEEIKVK